MSLYSSLEETDIERIERINRVIDLCFFLETLSRDFIPIDRSLCVPLRLISTNGKRRRALLAGVHWTTCLLPRNSGFSKRNRSRTVRQTAVSAMSFRAHGRDIAYMQAVRFESARKSSAIFLFRAVHRLRSLSKSQSLHAKH